MNIMSQRLNRTSTRSRLVRTAVWLLLGTVVAFAAAAPSDSTPMAPGPIETTTVFEGVTNGNVGSTAPADDIASVATATAVTSGDPEFSAATTTTYWKGSSDVNSLPAWRWGRIAFDADTSGFLGPFKEIPVVLCTLLFIAAQFFWSLILGLLKFAFDAGSLIGVAAPVINSGAAAIGRYLVIFFILFWAIALWKIIKLFTKGNAAGAFRSGLVFILLFGMMFTVITTATKATKLEPSSQINVAGTLPWMAQKAASFAGSVTGQLALADDLAMKTGIIANPEGVTPTCNAYITTIHKAYDSGSGNKAMSSMSKLWEQTQYRAWAVAMFGQPTAKSDLPGRALCHYAEAVNQVPASEQQTIASYAYPGIVPLPADGRYLVFGPHDEKHLRKATIAWAACKWDGSAWGATPAFKGVWRESTTEDAMASGCARAFSTSTRWNAGAGSNDDPMKVYGNSIDDAFDKGSVEHREALTEARNFVEAFSGMNASDRIFQGFLALIVALLFFYVLGFISIGMVAAQLMLVVLLIIAPLVLAMYAMGSKKANGLLRLTGTTAVSQAFFGLILTALIVLTGVFQNLAATVPASGFIKSLVTGFAPLAAFYIIQRILKSIGMVDIMRPTGAMSFVASAALLATRDGGEHGLARHAFTGKDGRNGVQRGVRNAADSARRGGMNATANALKGYAATRSASRWTRGMSSAEGRAERKVAKSAMRDAALESRRNKVRDGYAKRLDSGKQTRFARLANWASERSLGDDNLSRTMLRAADAASRAGAKADPNVKGAWKNLMEPGSNWYDQRLLPKPGEADGIKVNKPSLQDSETARSKARLTKAKMDSEIKRNPGSAAALQVDMMSETFDNLAKSSFGDDFSGFSTASDLAAAKLAAARSAGVGYSELALSSNGIVVPQPGSMTRDTMRNLPADELSKFVYWLPKQDRMLEEGETPDMYAARMTAIGVARGLVTTDGMQTDVFAKMGLNMDDAGDRARVEAWQSGQKDAKLDKIEFRATDSAHERRLIEAARAAMTRSTDRSAQRQANQQVVAFATMQSSAAALPDIVVANSSSTAQLESSLTSYSTLLEKIDKAKARPDMDPAVMAELDTLRRDSVKKIEEQFNSVRERLYSQVHDTVAIDIDAEVAFGKIASEAQIADKVLGELEAFAGAMEQLEGKLNGMWLGQAGAASELASMLATVASDVNTYTSAQVRRAADAAAAAPLDYEGRAAAVRRTAGNQKLVSGRDLAKAFQALEFPS